MDEKKYSICSICKIVGDVALDVALSVSLILAVAGSTPYLLAIKLLYFVIAAIAFAIILGIEISSEETWGLPALVIAGCLFNIALTAMQLG